MLNTVFICIILFFGFYHGNCTGENCSYDITNNVANCSFMGLHDVPNSLPNNVLVLDLTGNRLSYVRKKAFAMYKDLDVLYLSYNEIHSIEDDAFHSLNKLRTLYLTGNHLRHTNYTKNVFQGLANLQELYLNRNRQAPSPTQLFCKDTPCNYSSEPFIQLINLKTLSIDLCGKSIFGKGFLNLTRLEKLSFDYCLACSLYNKTFENFRNSNITELNLSNCLQYKVSENIESGILSPFPGVTSLDLSNSYFSLKHALALLGIYKNKKMDVINFHRVSRASKESKENPYRVIINKHMMRFLKTICVKTLILSYNGIMGTEPNALFLYDHPHCFENIILSANCFTLGYNALYMEVLVLIKQLTSVVLFDYSYVPLQYENMEFILPPNLDIPKYEGQEITVRSHHLTATNMTFFMPTNLTTLRFSHVMSASNLFSLAVRNTQRLRYLDLSYFQFQGFPDIYMPDGHSIRYFDFSGIDARIYVDKGVTRLMRDVNTVVLKDANLDLTYREGKDVFRYFRNNTTNIDISNNHLMTLPRSFKAITNLVYLNISHNSFRQFPIVLLSLNSIQSLDLRFNQLLALDQDTTNWIDGLHQQSGNFNLYLAGNEFSCVCDYKSFIDWLSRTDVLLDINRNYSCTFPNGTRIRIPEVIQNYHRIFSHCNAIAWLRTGVICIVSSFFVIGLTAIIYQFRWRFTYFMYRQLKSRYIKEDPFVFDFVYDVFVAYANDCSEWLVESLIPTLEQEWNLNVCIKDRDFPIGADRGDTVVQSIRNSKYVIFILTPGFINRKWGRFEIEMAKYEMFEQRGQKRIIVILKDGVTKEDIPPEFASIWRDIKLIEWPADFTDGENVWYDLKFQLIVN